MVENDLSGFRGSVGFLEKAGDRIARLGAFAHPIIGAIQIEFEVVAFLQRLIGANFLNELAVTRTAAVGHDDAEHRRILCADPFHANFY